MAIDRKAIDEAAASWVARRLGDGLPPDEAAAFDAWLDAAPEHVVAYARAEAAWERSGRLAGSPFAEAPRRAMPEFTRRAAAALLAVGGTGAMLGGWWVMGDASAYATPVGGRRKVRLPDQSLATLNTATSIELDFDDRRRSVRLLSGEALFEVAHDAARPFVVMAGEAQFRAVGTAFNVRMRPDLVELTVAEGVVAIDARPGRPAAAPALVRAGTGAAVGASAVARIGLDQEELRRRLAWNDGIIEFRGETLEQAVAEFNRYQSARLVVADPRIASLRIGGTFGTLEADKFVRSLEAGFGIRAIAGEGGSTLLVPAPEENLGGA